MHLSMNTAMYSWSTFPSSIRNIWCYQYSGFSLTVIGSRGVFLISALHSDLEIMW